MHPYRLRCQLGRKLGQKQRQRVARVLTTLLRRVVAGMVGNLASP